MGKTRDLFKKIRGTKGTFHAKMGSIKDRNGMDLTEAEDIKRGGKNTYKKDIYDSDNHDPEERQCERMFKLLHHCTHLAHQESKAQNSPKQASTVYEP